jgi:TolB-like protein/tetratricopeptide (TPR) repeat protein
MHPVVPAFRFAEFTLHPAERQLLKGREEVVLRPKAFDTLLCLVRHHGHVVSKDRLLDAVWPDTNVSEAVLTHCIAEVRQALADDVRGPRFIKTLSRHGYKFVAPVAVVEPAAAPEAAAAPLATAAPASAIVVLPFANMSADPDNEYFCDGLAEELINALTKLGRLDVVAHSSSFSFKGRDVDAREIGRQLHVGTILEGSVRKDGDRLRVSAQLVDAARGYHVWCEQYDRRLEDVFVIQEEIARAILDSLPASLFERRAAPLVKPGTSNMEAYQLYLRGRSFWHRRFGGCLQNAMDCFARAIAADPGYALPYTGLADSLSSLGIWAFAHPRDVFPKAVTLAETAARLDEGLAEAHASRALIRLFWDWEWDEAERGFQRALERNPGSAVIRLGYGHLLSIVGRMDDALSEMKRAQSLDPISPVCTANVGWTFYLAHQLDEAIAELQKVLARDPSNGIALFYLGYVLIDAGRCDEAIEVLQNAVAVTQGMPWAREGIGLALGKAGRRDEARAMLRDTEARSRGGYLPPSAVGFIHLGLGEDEAVLDCLERGVEEHDPVLPWIGFMPCLDRLHPHPRFKAILSRLGLGASCRQGSRRPASLNVASSARHVH